MVLEALDFADASLASPGGGMPIGAYWRPDWPLDLPPDAFKVQKGTVRALTIIAEGEGAATPMAIRYSSDLTIEEYPFFLNGRMAQVLVSRGDDGELLELNFTFKGGEPPLSGEASDESSWKFQFPKDFSLYLPGNLPPDPIKVSFDDMWFFIYLSGGGNELLETWYDEEGNVLGIYAYSFLEIGKTRRLSAIRDCSKYAEATEFHYDSRGFITDSSGPEGIFNTLYFREDLPRYRESWPAGNNPDMVQGPTMGIADDGNPQGSPIDQGWVQGGEAGIFSLQWDEEGLLVRIAEIPQAAGGNQDRAALLDYRYEYSFDEEGNWIERKEVRMIRQFGFLAPSAGIIFTRVLEYY